jgi:serine phosphatase RsbU (regulator of sigma subunit)
MISTENLSFSKLEVEFKKLHKKNKELISNITYAEVVQQGILPHERHFNRLFENYFILYKAQGIISGDLYWVGQKGKKKYFAVGDCTGHGVSGAMLSVVALSFLNYIVLGKEFDEIGDVLSRLDKKWIETFHQGAEAEYNNDWLEIGICSFDEETQELQFAGANNKLILINKNNITEFSGNKYPIGGWQIEKNRDYKTFSLILKEKTSVYLYSDGFKDQFGEISKKRFSSKRFREMLLKYNELSMVKQKKKIEMELNSWKGSEEQTDDICLLGLTLLHN